MKFEEVSEASGDACTEIVEISANARENRIEIYARPKNAVGNSISHDDGTSVFLNWIVVLT